MLPPTPAGHNHLRQRVRMDNSASVTPRDETVWPPIVEQRHGIARPPGQPAARVLPPTGHLLLDRARRRGGRQDTLCLRRRLTARLARDGLDRIGGQVHDAARVIAARRSKAARMRTRGPHHSPSPHQRAGARTTALQSPTKRGPRARAAPSAGCPLHRRNRSSPHPAGQRATSVTPPAPEVGPSPVGPP